MHLVRQVGKGYRDVQLISDASITANVSFVLVNLFSQDLESLSFGHLYLTRELNNLGTQLGPFLASPVSNMWS